MDLHITLFICIKTSNPKVSESKNQEELAKMIGISVDTLNNYKKLTELIPELEDKEILQKLISEMGNKYIQGRNAYIFFLTSSNVRYIP